MWLCLRLRACLSLAGGMGGRYPDHSRIAYEWCALTARGAATGASDCQPCYYQHDRRHEGNTCQSASAPGMGAGAGMATYAGAGAGAGTCKGAANQICKADEIKLGRS